MRDIIEHVGKTEKIDIIITFISILELARLGKISAFQNEETSEIYLRVVSALDNFDVREADGFDEEAQEKPEEEKEELNPEKVLSDPTVEEETVDLS